MKHKSLVKALEKAGFTIGRPFAHSDRADAFRVQNGKNILSWYFQNDNAICVHACTMQEAQDRDSMRDYFPGSYCHTIKAAIASLGELQPFDALTPEEIEAIDISEIIF
jgi:hypothetical protein